MKRLSNKKKAEKSNKKLIKLISSRYHGDQITPLKHSISFPTFGKPVVRVNSCGFADNFAVSNSVCAHFLSLLQLLKISCANKS